MIVLIIVVQCILCYELAGLLGKYPSKKFYPYRYVIACTVSIIVGITLQSFIK